MGWNTKPKMTFEAFSSSNISTITIKNLLWNWTLFNKMHIPYHLKHLCFKKGKRNLVCHSNFTATIRIKILKVSSNKLTFLWHKLKFTAFGDLKHFFLALKKPKYLRPIEILNITWKKRERPRVGSNHQPFG